MAGRLKADFLVILWTVHHVKIKSLPYAVTKQRSCILAASLTGRQRGDLLACEDIGRENDSMLSLTLIFRNFHLAARGADRWRQRGARVGSACRNGEGGATRADITTTAGGLPRDRWFESGFLQQPVSLSSEPPASTRRTPRRAARGVERVNDFDTAGGRSLGSQFGFFERRKWKASE